MEKLATRVTVELFSDFAFRKFAAIAKLIGEANRKPRLNIGINRNPIGDFTITYFRPTEDYASDAEDLTKQFAYRMAKAIDFIRAEKNAWTVEVRDDWFSKYNEIELTAKDMSFAYDYFTLICMDDPHIYENLEKIHGRRYFKKMKGVGRDPFLVEAWSEYYVEISRLVHDCLHCVVNEEEAKSRENMIHQKYDDLLLSKRREA